MSVQSQQVFLTLPQQRHRTILLSPPHKPDNFQHANRTSSVLSMSSLLDIYSKDFPPPTWPLAPIPHPYQTQLSSQTILITGTTGRLGSHLLAHTLANPDTARVYALNYDPTGDATHLRHTQRLAFHDLGLNPAILDSPNVVFHYADLAKPSFGLQEDTFQEMRSSVTAIIHNGWRVNFKLPLSSFESLIAGTRGLIDFALTSPIPGGPKILFVSSISSLFGYSCATPAPESLDFGPEFAAGLGYGESKWVAEHVLWRATQQTGLRTTSVRVGQLSGDSRAGIWKVKEWTPLMVRTSKRLGCVPVKDDTVSWLPIDVASMALLDMLSSGEPILHLTAPRPTPWNNIFGAIAAHLDLPVVPSFQWMVRLRQSPRTSSNARDYGHALTEFFETTLAEKAVVFGTEKAVEVSHTLAAFGSLDVEDVMKWLAYWESIGFLNVD